ncbi:SDR family NAD(P)-dependent oxidoreductase [Pseudonocardia sp. GCM10023141]|uniref:SDR family NAD(P)-dependent oxidoreductase n=1 Tax=Pseudonocardia sp. GCM10023141 TaxID=3252653 RepID=UPI00360E12EF
MPDLTGRAALVTGAGSGIGAACATGLAAAGAAVLVTDIDGDAAARVAAKINAGGGRAVAERLDVADEAQWVAVVGNAAFDVPITVLHNNAAITGGPAMAGDLDVVRIDVDTWDAVLAVALRGTMLGCKHVVPGMLAAGGGSIVNTSSVKGSTGSSYRTAYATAKGGIDALTRMVATSYGKRNIRCNAVAPGIVETPGLRHTVGPERIAELQDAHLVPRLGRAADIAAMVVFLASDDAAFLTGQVIAVDGGLTAHAPSLSPPGSR